MKKHVSLLQVSSTLRYRYLWLVLAVLLSLFATNGRWDLPLAAWLAPLFLLRFTRTSNLLLGYGGALLTSIVSMTFFLYQSQMLESPIIIVAAIIIGIILSIPYLLDRLITSRLSPVNALLATLAFPLGKVLSEYLVTLLLPFGSVLSLAYTQHDNVPLLQLLAITGTYGISFLMAWFASVGNFIWERDFSWSRVRTIAVFYSCVLILVLLGGSVRLTFFAPSATTIRVAGISPAFSVRKTEWRKIIQIMQKEQLSDTDFSALHSSIAAINEPLLLQSQREAQAGAKIVVWPESAAATLAEEEAGLLERGKALAKQEGMYLEIGYVVLHYQHSLQITQNRTALFDPQGRVNWIYDKAHPIPGMEDYVPGDGKVPVVETSYGTIASVICFDADFPDLMRQGRSKGVDIMLVPSNDWRGIDPWQTYNTTFRAIENGYSLVRQTSNGLSMTVDYQGRVLAATDYFTTEHQTMIASVPSQGGQTIYAIVGDVFAWLCMAALCFLVGLVIFTTYQRHLRH
ncbi:nitrilase-related carbon-nitrogen hydrolase [Ktedonospora formicarum]|uniref:Apolipoprotein N-acyltransferase n=1 Tax=Ktedonospora formicarum TaxID=2778364 RepID=A0A8J3MY96_9CHLR|nr:nitrilase-related carbon-nitrogen hydrolase [Ktedonospora formicarum]GHO50563.1 apolipoprotein N-acyltransferase [Ktedonospora formicarum]